MCESNSLVVLSPFKYFNTRKERYKLFPSSNQVIKFVDVFHRILSYFLIYRYVMT